LSCTALIFQLQVETRISSEHFLMETYEDKCEWKHLLKKCRFGLLGRNTV
jgi:hypothetical protein